MNESATKIQAIVRGKKSRSEVKMKKTQIERNKSALKIQSIFRGNAGRKHVKNIKDER